MSDSGDSNNQDVSFKQSKLPYKIERHLEFIDIYEDGSLFLGSSNLNGRYWIGSIWYFNSADDAPANDNSVTGHSCDSGVPTGKFLNSSQKVIVGEDTGTLTIYELTTYKNGDIYFVPEVYSAQHESSILSLSFSRTKNKIISAGTDKSINVWDVESLSAVNRYCEAHTRPITSTAFCPEEDGVTFISCSLDGYALMWDSRNAKPASVLSKNKSCGFTAVDWRNTNEIAIGSQSGDVMIMDVRARSQLTSFSPIDRPVHKISFQDGMLAICGDTNRVIVWDTASNDCFYADERHTDFVRDVVWHPKTRNLYTCGFDCQVLSHSVVEASPA